MIIKWIGGIMILVGCSAVGFILALSYRKEVAVLQHFIDLINDLECELQFKTNKLQDVFLFLSQTKTGLLHDFCKFLSDEINSQIQPSVRHCVSAALQRCPDMPLVTKRLLEKMGNTLGQFDLNGQLLELKAIKSEAELVCTRLFAEQNTKINNFKTFGICAGAAIVILFI